VKLWPALAGSTALAVAAHLAVTATASTMTVAPAPGVVQTQATGLTVTNRVTDRFTVATTTPLEGQTTNFDGGSGVGTDGGPAWSASADWTNPSADYVIRDAGSDISIARFAWLTRRSTLSARITSYGTGVQAGVVLGSDADGTQGIAAVLYYDGGYRFGLFTVSSGTATACSPALALSGSGGRTVTLTFSPATGGTATGTISGGGGDSVTSTCSLSGVTGSYAGLYSNSATTTRYDNISATL
jgi:hypothetical protein